MARNRLSNFNAAVSASKGNQRAVIDGWKSGLA